MAAYSLATLEPAIQWFALYVRPNHEKATEQGLTGKGYAPFSPVCRIKKKYAERTKVLDLPLFPGYVFCQFDPNRRLPVLTTPGVIQVVSAGSTPQPIEEHEIASVRAVVDSKKPAQPWPFLKEGQSIRIQAGPLCGAEGKLLRSKNENRLIVSITLLQRSIAVELDQDTVLPLF